jgi:AcrR family transcriptional regulator
MADQRREQMLQAALEVIVERGYADTRIADVAERAGASPALVIYYFKTKDQLLTEAIRYSEDSWYEAGTQRMAAIGTAAGRLEELIAMTCLPEDDIDPNLWLLWLDLWAQSARNPGGGRGPAEVRRAVAGDDPVAGAGRAGRRRVRCGRRRGVCVTLSALLHGFAVPIALEDPQVTPARAFELSMKYASGQLGFPWSRRRGRN